MPYLKIPVMVILLLLHTILSDDMKVDVLVNENICQVQFSFCSYFGKMEVCTVYCLKM